MATCDDCGALKLSEQHCRGCGGLLNREDTSIIPEWRLKKIRANRRKRIARMAKFERSRSVTSNDEVKPEKGLNG